MVQFLYPSALQKWILAWIPKSVQRNRQLRDVEATWWGTWCQAVLLPSEACPPSRQTDHLNQGHRESEWHEAESCRKMKYGDSFTDLDNQQQRTWSSRLCAVAWILFYVHLLYSTLPYALCNSNLLSMFYVREIKSLCKYSVQRVIVFRNRILISVHRRAQPAFHVVIRCVSHLQHIKLCNRYQNW